MVAVQIDVRRSLPSDAMCMRARERRTGAGDFESRASSLSQIIVSNK